MTQPQLTIDQAMDLAVQHHSAGHLPEAERLIRQVLAVHPSHPGALHVLAVIAYQVRRFDDAAELLGQAIAVDPGEVAHRILLGQVRIEMGRLDEAIASFQDAIRQQPGCADAYNGLGNAYRAGGKFEQAVAAYSQAIALQPGNAELHNNLGAMLHHVGRLDDAIAAYRMALGVQPQYALACLNLGTALQLRGEFSLAMEAFNRAMAIAPNDPAVRFNIGLLGLLRGAELAQGLLKLEPYRDSRRVGNALARIRPQWNGSEVQGKRILLFAEQGVGDIIHVIRFVPAVARRGGKIILTCQPGLTRLFRFNFPDVQVVTHDPGRSPQLPEVDLTCPLLTLPLVLNATYADIPAQVPFLGADPALSARWGQRLAEARLKVGLVWAANPTFRNDRYRSMQLEMLAPFGQASGVDFISLQKGTAAEQAKMPPAGMRLHDWTDDLNDFADTAALIDNLDLVITVDTAVAHLAGAMGKPTWVLLGLVPDWRWLLDRTDSPWYPTMRLFRQTSLNDWQTPIQQVLEALNSFRP